MQKYKPLYSLYKGLRESKYDVPDSYASFQKTLTQAGDAGAKSRRGLYQSLKDSNYDVPDTYEDFYKNLFVPVNSTTSRALKIGENPNTPTVNRYRQKMFDSVDPNKNGLNNLSNRAVGQAVRATNNVRKPVIAKVVNQKGKPTGKEFAITPAKTVEDLDREYAQETTKNWENELHDQMADADKDAAKISDMFKSFIGSTDEVGSVWGNMTRGGGIAGTPHSVTTNNGILENTEARQLLAASDYNRKRRELLQLEKDSRNGAIFDNHSFFRGMYDAAKDTGFLTGGASDLINAGSLLATKQDLDNGVHTEAGDMLMQQAVKNSDAQSQYGDNQGWMYTGGVITTNMAPFMVQIGSAGFSKGMSNAIGKVVQGSASKVALGTMEKATGMVGAHIANYIGKVTGLTTKAFGKAIQYGIVGAAQANTVGLGNVANDVINRYTGQVYQDEQGNYKFGTFDSDGKLVHEGGEDFLTALVKGDAAQTIEFATELAGGGIDAVGTALKNFVSKGGKKIINKYNMENVSKVVDFLLNNKVSKNARYLKAGADRTLGKVELNSIVGESLEEELGIIANTVFTGDNKISDLWDEKQQSQIWGGMLLSIGLMKGAVAPFHAYNAKQYYSYKHKLDKADVNLSQLLGKEKWEELRNQIDATTNEDMPEMVNRINRDVALGKNRQPVREYIQNLLIMRGYDIGNMLAAKKAVEDKGEGVSVKNMEKNQAYQQGRDAYGYDTHEIQLDQEDKQKSLAQLIGISEQQLASMSDEELEALSGRDDNIDRAIYDYQLSTARYEGVIDNARDQIDLEVQRAAQAVDMYTDKSSNTIRNATIKATGGLEDYGVYIINGNIATHEDGSIDISNSDDMILYYDPTTNTVEHADATMFVELGSEENADEVRSQAMADAKEKAIKETTGIIDGVVEVGTQFKTVGADGTEHTYEVLADNGDGTAMITIDGNVPTELVNGESVNIPVSFEELQKMKDEYDQQRLQAAKAEREQMEKERAAKQTQETEQTQPSFDFNQILNDNGNVVLVDVLDEDGNTKYPNSKLFLIRDAGAKAKVVELKSDGTIVPHAVNKEDVATISSMSLDEYKQAMPESSMIEDNSGEESDEDSQLANLGLPKGSEIWMSGDGFGRPKENTLSRVVGIDEQGSIVLEDKDGKKWSASFDYINNHRELPPLDENTNIVNEENNQSESNAEENTPAPEQTPAITLEDGTIVPMLEDGNPDFSKLTAAQTAELYDTQFGEDADSIVSGYVSDAKKALDKASNMTVKGKNFVEQKAAKDAKEKAIADAQAAYDSAIAIRDAYNERQLAKVEDTAEGRKELIEKARRKFARLKSAVKDDAEAVSQLYRDTIGSLLHRLYDGTGIDVTDTIPLTAEEYVASNLGAHSLNYEGTETSKGVKQETGLSREDFAKTQLLAADGKGTTIDVLVHSLWENRPSNLESLDTQDIRNALIGVLNSGFKASEARNFVENIRIAQAENILEEQKRAQENAAYAEQHKAEPEAELKAKSDEKAELKAKSEAKLDNESDNESNDLGNDLDNEKTNDKINDNINAPEVPEDATDENPLGLQLSEDKVPFEIEGGKSGETYDINDNEDRQRLINDNKVDDKDILDIDMPKHVHKAIKELCKKMGLKVQFLYMGARSNGWIENGTMYLALDTEKATQFVFGHEMTHAIKKKNPEAYKELVKVAMAVTTKKKFEEDLAKVYQNYHGISGYNNVDDYVEEVVADNLGKFINDFDLAQKFSLRLNHPILGTILLAIQKIKSLLYGDFYKSVDALERIVEKAYVETAKGQVTNSETGEDVSFSLRQKPEPKKKGIGYKVFVLKDGKLYPPMVANPDGAATPVGVWLDADAAPIAGESKTGRPQVKQGGKGTQGGSGKLAYRPGWHLGVVPYAIQFNRKDAEGNKTLFPKNFVFAEVEYAADVDYQEEARQEGINPSGKYQHSLAGLKHLPTDGYYMYRTNPNPETDPWVITGAMKVNRILTRAEQAELVKNAGREPQQIQDGDIVTDDVVNSINQEIAAAPKFSLKVYHGSGADFTEFDFDHMGEGEGSQAFGWGGYVTNSKKIGEDYTRRAKSRKANHAHFYANMGSLIANDWYEYFVKTANSESLEDAKEFVLKDLDIEIKVDENKLNRNEIPEFKRANIVANLKEEKRIREIIANTKKEDLPKIASANLYEVDIPEDNGSNYLDWDAPITDELIDKVAKALPSLRSYDIKDLKKDRTFDNFYKTISMRSVTDDASFNDDKAASKLLASLGYTGIKYKAGRNFGGAEEGDTNYVIFKPEDMKITEHTKFSIKTYHGSQASFDHFDHSFMGSGEGAQAYGWGTYVSEVEGIAKAYAKSNATIHSDNGYKEALYKYREADFNYHITETSYKNAVKNLKEKEQLAHPKIKNLEKELEEAKSSGDTISVGFLETALKNWNEVLQIARKEVSKYEDTILPNDKDVLEKAKKRMEELMPERNLYSVDIPDDTGRNYIGWDEPLGAAKIMRLPKVFKANGWEYKKHEMYGLRTDVYTKYANGKELEGQITVEPSTTGGELYKQLASDLGVGSDKAASEFLSKAGFVGVKVIAQRNTGGSKEGKMNYVIFDENNAKITSHTKFSLKTKPDVNMKSAVSAMIKIAEGADYVPNAVVREDLEQYGGDKNVGFYWGKTGNPNKEYKGGYGLAHIGAKHGEEVIRQILDVMCNGKIDRYVAGNKTAVLSNGKFECVVALTRNGNKESWLLSGWDKIEKAGGNSEVSTQSVPMQGSPTFSRTDLGAALSAAKIDNSSETTKKNGEKVDVEGTKFSLKDEEYLKAVEDGNMEKAQKMVNEAADAAGYSTDSSYQGTSAFNGAAPWGNGYFLTKDERKEAWDNGEFEGESTLGDYINDDIDGGNLEELTNAASYRAADPMRKEAIDNVRNAIQKKAKTITMYRSVPSDVKEGSFRNGDWVTPSRAYAVDNAKLHGWGDDYNIIEQKVPVDDVWFDGNDIAEWGYGREEDYINDTDFAYKNSKNNKKLLDTVTYDDNGNVIPLSQRFNEKNKDVRFSLKDEKTMFGMHNISVDKLRKAIKQGGFAAPSMGVVDSKNGIYSDYGEITLIPKAEKLAKRTGKNAGTFTADAWTPTYPQVERIMNKQGEKAFNTDMNEKLGDVDNGIYSNIRESWKGYLSSGDVRDGLYWHYLFDKGMNPETIYQTGKYDNDITNEVMRISDNGNKTDYTDKEVAELIQLMNKATGKDNDVDAQREKLKARIASAEKKGNHLLVALKKKRLAELEGVENFYIAADFVNDVVRNNRKNGKVDVHKTMDAAKEKVENDKKLSDGFPSWLDKKTEEYGVEEMLYNGTTPSGKPKYIPNTIENAVKLMKKQGVAGGYTAFGSELGVFIAKNSPEVNTLAAMKNAKDKLIPFGDERHNQIKDKITKEFLELSDEIRVGSNNRYAFDDSGVSRMVELTDHKGNEKEYLKKAYNVEVSDEWMDRYNKLLDTIKKDYKVFYFETKFMRPYGLDEFEKAIVPSDTPSDVVDALKKAGIDVSSYERGNAEDRQKVTMDAINSSDNIRFSLKSMMAKPEGWKQANKKAIHIAEAIERDPKFSLKNLDGTLIKAGTYFSGGGLVEEGLKGIIDPVVAVEYDEKISGVYCNNFGQHIVTADVRDVDPKELVKQIDGEVEYFHASPVCKNYSQAKSNHAEVELDKETAASTAEFINAIKPKVVTIENVKGYKDSDAMKTITDALDANGYTWDADVYNAADYGGYTNRERLIVRAVRDGKLPEKPKKMAHKSGWYEAVADIIPTLTEKKNGVAPWMDIRLKADGIDWRNIDKPLYVMGSAYADGKIPHAFADELLPTLRTKSGDVIVMPDGKVYRALGRVLARVSGVSDDYKMPFSENLSHTIIGNGIPTQLTEHVIAPLLTGSDPKFSIRTYHGTGASFDKFDLSHALEGEGSESFGHGVYVTNSSKIGREYAQRAKNRKMEDLYKNMRYPDGVKGDIFKRRVFGEMVNDVATGGSVESAKEFAKKRVGADANDIQRTLENLKDREKGTEYEQNLKDRLAEYKEGLKWIESLDEDYLTQGNANRYDVDIPDDNGSNYLDWEGTIPDSLDKQKVAEDAYKVVSDNQGFNDFKATPLNDFIAHTLKTYVNTTDVAGRVGKLKSDIKDVIENYVADDDVLALNEYLKDATPNDVLATIWYNDLVRDVKDADLGEELYRKLSTYVGDNAASQILSDNGLVGIKYPAGMIHGGAKEGDYNYVIFDENNANIVGNTKFSLRYDQFEHDLNQWKKDNKLPKDAQRPTIPQRNAGESAVDFLRRVDEYRKQMALWKTAPTYEQHLLSDDTALGEFNRELQRGSVLKRIAFQDSMLAIRKAQEAIMKEVGVDRLNMAEDAYTAENRSHGKGKNEFEEYNNEFLQPLRKAYHQMKKILGDSYDNVRIYMMAKHGLERDAQMAFKKSLEADYEDVAQRSAAYKAYKGDMNRIINDSDLEFGRVDFTTWRQRDNALRVKYSPSYMDYRYDKNGIAYDYSGLSAIFDGSDFEEAAHKLVNDIESKYVAETHDLWDATNAATKKILRDGYKAGMMSKDTYQYVRDMYSHYIPLRGWDGTTADQVWDYIGGGKGAFNQTLKKAHGRTSIADDPIAYIENMAESGILLNNKNWVKQHLMLLAQNHPTSLLTLSKAWYVKSTDANGNEEWIPATPQITSQMNSNQVKAAIDAFEKKMEQMAQAGDATQKRDGLNIAYPQTHSEEREHEVRVMKDGEEYVIYVNGDPQLAQAMNNTRAHRVREIQSGKLDRAAAWLGRKMAAAYTSLSPLFIPSNYFRDLTMTLASTAIREDGRYNYLLRKNLATSWNLGFMLRDYQNGKLRDKVNNGNATPKEQMFYDFMMNGGETGFVSSLDVEDLKKKFKNDLKDLDRWKTNPVKVGHTIMDGIEFLNRAIEDSNRFAVYMTSIQYGRSIDEAVNDAKDVTLNFNRKGTGEYGWQMVRNLYLFINPAVQSLQTLGALAKHHPFKFTAVTASWLVSGVLVPIVNAALMSLLGGDDDKDKYWQFTKWDRRNNLIMWVPFTHEYIKIPLAQEFRAFYGVGDMIASKMMGGELAEESWSQYAEDLLGQVVDMLPLDPTGYDGNIAVSLMPNAIRPVFELAFNVDFTGKPLFKETEYNKYDPNFTKAYVGTPDWLVRASRMMNSIGNDYPNVQQNKWDALGNPRYNLNNPAVVDHVLSSYLGGAYTMGSQVLGLITKSLNDRKEIKVADIPLVSKFVSNPDDRPVSKKQGDEFWDKKEYYDRASNTISKLKKQAKIDGDYSLLERFYGSEEYKTYKLYEKDVKDYKEARKKERAEESGDEYRPHQLNAEDIYNNHSTPMDEFEDMKLKQLFEKLNSFKTRYDSIVDNAPNESDGYYNTNKAAIDAIDEISLDKQEISELKKGFFDDGKDAYNAEDMKQIRELRKKILAVLEKANKVVVANQKAKAEK